ncbi:YtxH domain-containing protein [Carnobacterium viridans]|uniref:Gas vesicle protein n=1 Tax=Carnobacterium viridans TaxID=174587 RepID=A0A1H1BDM5_9LACT|nr:YtxH domain-containing protein [Carnobacterium viridans]UDE95830.1 YtxH domain-containing protein [Carnobacterium viridans]SDQ49941.1 Gas vesicle protein [Carnobacterium viridans]
MSNHFMNGLILGAAAGGIYGLLKSPRTGKENRAVLKTYVDDTTVLVNDVSKSVNDLKGAIAQLTNEGKTLAEEFTQDVKESVDEFTYEAEPRMRRIQEHTEKLTADVEDLTQSMKQV